MTYLTVNKESDFVYFLLKWFDKNKRYFPWRRETDPYKILVAEKMLQQTSYGHVLKIYTKFLAMYPTIDSLSKANPSDIEQLINPLGFHRQRAKHFSEMSKAIVNNHSGEIPSVKYELMELSGVGEYIANAVLCFAFNQDVPVVDVNVRKVTSRVFGWKFKDNELANVLSIIIPENKFQDFNWAIIDFSSIICSRKPKCKKCGFSIQCKYVDQDSNF